MKRCHIQLAYAGFTTASFQPASVAVTAVGKAGVITTQGATGGKWSWQSDHGSGVAMPGQ
jgi:hypothetical protein